MSGCEFNFCQAIYCWIQQHGLGLEYDKNGAFINWARWAMSLPLLPPQDIRPTFVLLCEEEVDLDEDFPTESLFADFKDYLRSEWMKVPEFISTHGLSTTTTNGAKCWRSRMKKESRCAHPNPFVFISMLTDLYETAAKPNLNGGRAAKEC